MTKMFLWLISQDTNNDYDTYGQAVVDWVSPNLVTALCVGVAADGLSAGQVVSASFRAG